MRKSSAGCATVPATGGITAIVLNLLLPKREARHS
ncbi:xanthine/uracil permease [Aeromonas veronii]|nr:xanthine/uracil permease [Aeromonas veronii]